MEKNINAVWTEMNDQLEGFVAKRVESKEVAKDILQDVFVKVRTNLEGLKDDTKLSAWIFQITRNVINDHYRSLKRKGSVALSFEPEQEEFATDLTQAFSSCIRPMIEALPSKYKEAVSMSEIEGIPQKELAERLGISYSGVKSRVQRGREKLKDLLLQCCSISTDRYGNILEHHRKECSSNCA